LFKKIPPEKYQLQNSLTSLDPKVLQTLGPQALENLGYSSPDSGNTPSLSSPVNVGPSARLQVSPYQPFPISPWLMPPMMATPPISAPTCPTTPPKSSLLLQDIIKHIDSLEEHNLLAAEEGIKLRRIARNKKDALNDELILIYHTHQQNNAKFARDARDLLKL